ncbi:MAG: diacylglycerol kinase [Pseudomonadota bacterium]
MKRIIAAFFNSLAGLRHGFLHEKAVQQEMLLFLVSIPVAPVIAKDVWHLILLWGILLLLLATELLNTGVEQVANRITLEYSDEIKFAKDAGSAAVLLVALIALAVWSVSLYQFWNG